MIGVMKVMSDDSTEPIPAETLKGKIDIGIITIRVDEFQAMLDCFPKRRLLKGAARLYHYARVRTAAKEELKVVVSRSPEQGTGATQALANNMISDLGVRWIFVVGIAGGFPDSDFTLGDVLLSKRIHDFSVGAAIEGDVKQFQDTGGPVHVEVENLVTNLQATEAALGDWNNFSNLRVTRPTEQLPKRANGKSLYGDLQTRTLTLKALKKHFGADVPSRAPKYFDAPLISGNTLLKDTKLAAQWRQNARHAAGVEMEVAGACLAARYGGNVRVLAIRGISDLVGYARRPEWTEFACRSAAAFACALISSGLIRRN